MGGTLDAGARQQWASTLHQTFGQEASLEALPFKEQLSLAWAFRYLGAGEDARRALVAWMVGSDAWKSESPEMLAWLAQNLGAAGKAADGLREQLAEHVEQAYVGTTEETRKGSCWAWSELARNLTRDLNWPSRKAWADKLRKAYAVPTVIGSLNVDEALALGAALDHLQAGPSWDVLVSYMENRCG